MADRQVHQEKGTTSGEGDAARFTAEKGTHSQKADAAQPKKGRGSIHVAASQSGRRPFPPADQRAGTHERRLRSRTLIVRRNPSPTPQTKGLFSTAIAKLMDIAIMLRNLASGLGWPTLLPTGSECRVARSRRRGRPGPGPVFDRLRGSSRRLPLGHRRRRSGRHSSSRPHEAGHAGRRRGGRRLQRGQEPFLDILLWDVSQDKISNAL